MKDYVMIRCWSAYDTGIISFDSYEEALKEANSTKVSMIEDDLPVPEMIICKVIDVIVGLRTR